jgi:serine/threonine protein kinase
LQIVHRDVKLQTILFFDGRFTLRDFSAASALTDGAHLFSDQVGTSVIMTPEISARSYRRKPTDKWSVVITVFSFCWGDFLARTHLGYAVSHLRVL